MGAGASCKGAVMNSEQTPTTSRARMLAQAEREYHPCDVGLHVCGVVEDDSARPLTLANHRLPSPEMARRAWAAARAELEDEGGEVAVDLFTAPYSMDDSFTMRRQMLPRLAAIVEVISGE